jgi:hypothetical protein
VKTQAQRLISSLAFLFFSFAVLSMPACSSRYRPIELDPDKVQYLQGWNGWARCEIDIQGPGYVNKETHTWSLRRARLGVKTTGSWTVVGAGRWDRGQPRETFTHEEWLINPDLSVIYDAKFLVSIAGGKVSIKPDHAQLHITDGIQGYSQQTVNNKPRKPDYYPSRTPEPPPRGLLSMNGGPLPFPQWKTRRPAKCSVVGARRFCLPLPSGGTTNLCRRRGSPFRGLGRLRMG